MSREKPVAVESAVAETRYPEPARRRSWAFGPGLVFALAALGPQDLVTNAAAGASYSYTLLWTVALVVLARYVVLEATARYVVVTGETLMSGYARAGRWAPWMILISIFLKRHLTAFSQLLLLGSSAELLLPVRSGWIRMGSALGAWTLGFLLMYWGRYKLVERISKPLLVILGGTLALAAVFSRPDPAGIARGALIPTAPAEQAAYSFAFILLALVGSGAGALSNLKYAAFVHEKGWRDPSFLRLQRTDLLLSGLGLYTMLMLVQIAAAATLYPAVQPLREVEDLLPMFAQVLGDSGRIVLGLGLWAAVFTTYTGATTGYSLLVADIWYNVLRPRPDGSPPNSGETPVYRWCLIWFCLSPLYVLLTDWKPVWLVLVQAVVLALLVPAIVIVLMWLTNDRRRMGRHTNGWAGNLVMAALVLVTVYLTWQSAGELWGKLIASIRP
jgi:Mn2+/Fe2+ NRAMP family transporter